MGVRWGVGRGVLDFISSFPQTGVLATVLAAMCDSSRHRRLLIALMPAAISCSESLAVYFCVSRVAVRAVRDMCVCVDLCEPRCKR